MEIDKETRNKALLTLLFITIGVLSFTIIGDFFTNENLYSRIIDILDKKKNFVLGLSGTSVTASFLIGLIPGDASTPLANQFANLSGYLTIILSILFFEKYLLTLIATIIFRFVIPVLCIISIVYLYLPYSNKRDTIKSIIIRVVAFSIILMSIIPVSVMLSDTIDKTYQNKVNQIVAEIEKEDSNNLFDKIVSFTVEIKDKVTNWFNNMIEYVAVAIVTSCLIPIATLFLFIFLANQILGTHIRQPNLLTEGKKIGNKINNESNNIKELIEEKANSIATKEK